MELIRGLSNLKASHRGCVATLGNFDGVHLGHRQILDRLLWQARELRLPATVITTEPLPREFLAPHEAPSRLTRLREKFELLAAAGVDRVLLLRFDRHLAALRAECFVQDILVKALGVKAMVIGDDLKFGHQRHGDYMLLERMGRACGFSVQRLDSHLADGQRISSTLIRAALQQGDLDRAAHLLGRPYHMSGRVIHGDKRGRDLGFPTANILLKRRRPPLTGIFAVEAAGLGAKAMPAVASVGYRPTFGGGDCLLEVYIFDFNDDIYGSRLQVRFLRKLREERRFESVPALVEQMQRDAAQAKQFFGIL
ncbi:MAG TPA: bifunctional riboflavin kinase/FAD synthetase [Gammaproteobacteria bacterium]|nr:bifunctional riboflavin kinase/FAD synthetase [Gammaproteobacteria bacterium]